jgi:hypothetical protein
MMAGQNEDETMSDLKAHCEMIARQIETGEYGFDADSSGDTGPNAYDYLSYALDIEYVKDSDGNYRGAIVLVAFGGPNIWIDTRWREVRGAWWSESCTVPYTRDELALDECLRDLCDC